MLFWIFASFRLRLLINGLIACESSHFIPHYRFISSPLSNQSIQEVVSRVHIVDEVHTVTTTDDTGHVKTNTTKSHSEGSFLILNDDGNVFKIVF